MGTVVVKFYTSLTLIRNVLETLLHAPAVLPPRKISIYVGYEARLAKVGLGRGTRYRYGNPAGTQTMVLQLPVLYCLG
jgi:hypothetical protein